MKKSHRPNHDFDPHVETPAARLIAWLAEEISRELIRETKTPTEAHRVAERETSREEQDHDDA